jgi:hypothetical protein
MAGPDPAFESLSSADLLAKLREAQGLLRHRVPDGDLAT